MSGRADVMQRVPGLAALVSRQGGACSRAQLRALGVDRDAVAAQVSQRRWQLVGPLAVVTYTGPVSDPARLWCVALTVAPGGALCAWTALAQWGLRGWGRHGVHVVVDRGATPPRIGTMVVHESRRHWRDDVRQRDGLPLHSVERAAVDAAAWSTSPRAVGGLLSATVQQGLTTPARIESVLGTVGRVRYRRLMAAVLGDIAGGARAMSEIDLARLCRRAGLPEPDRQQRRRDGGGKWRYLDVEWRLRDGRRVLLEIDGVGHVEVERWYDDLLRMAEIAEPGETVLRLPAMAARVEPDRVIAVLARHLRAPVRLAAARARRSA